MGMTTRLRKKELKPEQVQQVMLPEEATSAGMDAARYVASLPDDSPVFLNASSRKGAWVVNQYMKFKLANLFAGGFDAKEFGPLPVSIPMPSSRDVAAAAKMVMAAKRPLLLMGSQVRGGVVAGLVVAW